MSVKYLDNAGTQYLVNKIKAIDGKIPSESQITTMITTALNTYKEGIVTIVESLPQTGEEGKLYLMVDPSDSDVYIVYTWEENAFKRMGSKTFTLTVDSALSSTSTNPVQNKVIKSALDGKANASHTHGSITNDGKLGTASRVVITGADKKIGISTVTTTELGYLSGVTSAIQTQLNSKSATGHTHTAGDVAGLATVATSGSYNDLSNKPTINDSTITIQKNGSTVDTFTTNGSAKTINIPVPTKTSDLTNDSGFLTSTDISSKANDSEVLHKAQTETVTGEKTFKKDIKIIDLNANERPGVKFEVNGAFRTFEQAKDMLPDTDFGDFGVGTLWSGWVLDDNTKIQNLMSDYVINDITFGTTNYSSVIELNNYYKVKYEEADNIQTDLRGMLRFELLPYAGIQKDSFGWSNPKLYFYAMLANDEFGDTILGHEDARWSKGYIDEINCYKINIGGNSIIDMLEHIVSLSYVTHYSSTSLTSNSTNSLSVIDNQDSVKVNDKVIDSSGKMFYITSVDHRNGEFEVGNVVDTFAKDSDVVHKSGNENVDGQKTFSDVATFNSYLYFTNSSVTKGTIPQSTVNPYRIYFGSGTNYGASLFNIDTSVSNTGVQSLIFRSAENVVSGDDTRMMLIYDPNRTQPRYLTVKGDIEPNADNTYECGSSTNIWKNLYGYHGYFIGQRQNDEYSTNARTNLTLLANKDTLGVSGVLFDTYRQNTAQGTGIHILGIGIKENGVRYEGCRFGWYWDNNLNGYYLDFKPTTQGAYQAVKHNLGTSVDKWDTLNGINPGALCFPDLSSGLDISGYITDLTGASNINKYTPLVDGWISIGISNADFIELYIPSSLIGGTFTKSTINNYAQAFMPVIANKEVRIALKGSSIGWAKFYPNLGNV